MYSVLNYVICKQFHNQFNAKTQAVTVTVTEKYIPLHVTINNMMWSCLKWTYWI